MLWRTLRDLKSQKIPKGGCRIGSGGLVCGEKLRNRDNEGCACANEERKSSKDGNAGGVNDVVSQTRDDINLG
jgi:hypothetical protein